MKNAIIAKKDIICYKVVIEDKPKNLIGYYQQRYIYEKGIILEARNFNSDSQDGEVYKGFHSFKNWFGAFKFKILNDSGYPFKHKIRIVKCIIPEKSLYFIGKFNSQNNYCSNQIIIK